MRYQDYQQAIIRLREQDTEVFSIGESTFLQPIYAVHIGRKTGEQIILQGGIHAREWVTTALLIRLATIYRGSNTSGVYFVPCANPDGVRLALDGLDFVTDQDAKNNLLRINGSSDFSLYKANGRGVDLNVNFDADWGTGLKNVTYPNSQNYIGEYPASEKETVALVEFTKSVSPICTLSYHSKGELVYYGFSGQSKDDLDRDRRIAKRIADALGYDALFTTGSAGGYKDWCVRQLKIPAFTIEVGGDDLTHPVGLEHLDGILEDNRRVLDAYFDGRLL